VIGIAATRVSSCFIQPLKKKGDARCRIAVAFSHFKLAIGLTASFENGHWDAMFGA
jgi:hypothetical protein